jgi:HK97 gp10 family phage protein
MARSGIQGTDKLRRKLKAMEKIVQSGIRPAITETLQNVTSDAKTLAPVKEGDLQESINYKVSSDGMAGVAGPSAKSAIVKAHTDGSAFSNKKSGKIISQLSKKRLFQFFKGYWIEFGTKGNPSRNIPPMPARPFMQPAWDMNKKAGIKKVKDAVNKQLKTIAELP